MSRKMLAVLILVGSIGLADTDTETRYQAKRDTTHHHPKRTMAQPIVRPTIPRMRPELVEEYPLGSMPPSRISFKSLLPRNQAAPPTQQPRNAAG